MKSGSCPKCIIRTTENQRKSKKIKENQRKSKKIKENHSQSHIKYASLADRQMKEK
jgi:hypothetical protein